MKSYKDLEIYRLSYEKAIQVHNLSINLPKYELYEEGSQARRSSKSITANIVEGYGRKRYKADLIKFLIYAHASCDETILHLNFIKDIHTSFSDKVGSIIEEYEELSRKINRFIQYVENQWK